MTIEERLKEIKERCDAATEGKWLQAFYRGPIEWSDGMHMTIAAHGPNHKESDNNAVQLVGADMAFIAHARTDVPMLLNMVLYLSAAIRTDPLSDVDAGLKKIAEKYSGVSLI